MIRISLIVSSHTTEKYSLFFTAILTLTSNHQLNAAAAYLLKYTVFR